MPEIRDKVNGTVLASGGEDTVLELEGNLYFDKAAVNSDALEVTDETYTCPYKGTCNWVDIRGGARKVAWVYPEPKEGYEQIKDRYGFYKGDRQGTVEAS